MITLKLLVCLLIALAAVEIFLGIMLILYHGYKCNYRRLMEILKPEGKSAMVHMKLLADPQVGKVIAGAEAAGVPFLQIVTILLQHLPEIIAEIKDVQKAIDMIVGWFKNPPPQP